MRRPAIWAMCQNLPTNMTIFTMNTNIEMARSDGCQKVMVSAPSTADIRCHNSRISARGVSTGVILLGGYWYGRIQADG
jgi:hypothetical protein